MTIGDETRGSIDLAREADLRIGGVVISPSTSRIRSDDHDLRIEPRVMLVLMLLVERAPQTVSRDTLIDACWGGRIVSDDAVARVVAQIRAAARAFEPAPFAVETLPKVGFRLVPRDDGDAPGPVQAPAPRLAVLPFDDLGDEPDAAHLCDGIPDEILHTLANREGLSVIGRSSSFQFRGDAKTVENVVARLGATHVLDGAVRIAGGRIRVSAEIVSCATRTAIWSHRIERDRDDVFAVQEEMATAAAAALSHVVRSEGRPAPRVPQAYDLYLRARKAVDRWHGGGDADLLASAVTLDPAFAPAWASLALTRAGQTLDKTASPAARQTFRTEAHHAADTALRLDPGLAAAHVARSLLQPVCGAFEEGDADIERALDCGPRDPWALFYAAEAAETRGRLHEALGYSERARRIEPYWPQGLLQLASILEDTGDQARADEIFDQACARWPDLDYVHVSALFRAAYAERWSRVEAIEQRLADSGTRGPNVSRALRRVEQLRSGGAADAAAKLERERRRIAETGTMSLNIALLCRDGYADAAFELVERASFAHLFEPGGLTVLGDLRLPGLFFSYGRAMRADPRFVRLCGKLGLAQYWLRTGRWPDCVEETADAYDFKAECRRVAN